MSALTEDEKHQIVREACFAVRKKRFSLSRGRERNVTTGTLMVGGRLVFYFYRRLSGLPLPGHNDVLLFVEGMPRDAEPLVGDAHHGPMEHERQQFAWAAKEGFASAASLDKDTVATLAEQAVGLCGKRAIRAMLVWGGEWSVQALKWSGGDNS